MVECLPSAAKRRGKYSATFQPKLKRIIVLVYTHEVISTTIAEKTIQSRFNWHLNSRVENVQAAQSMRKSVYRSFKHCDSQTLLNLIVQAF